MADRKLTPKRQRFVDAYTGEAMGNATEAARIAGYKSPKSEGCRLLTFADVVAEVHRLSQPAKQAAIATREERLAFYTEMMRGDAQDKDRLKAAELLGKVQGDFIERQQVEHSGGAAVEIKLTPQQARELAEGDDE